MPRPAWMRDSLAIAGLSLAVATAGCTRSEKQESADARTLEGVLAADHSLEAALRDADGLSRTDEKAAADLLEGRALPIARDVVVRASGASVSSAWGADRKNELIAVATERRDELPRYAKALREGDMKTKLEALETQLKLQKKALDAAIKVSQVPP